MNMTAMDLVNHAKQVIKEVDIQQAKSLLAQGAIPLDVREQHEFDAGHLPNARHIPRGMLEFMIGTHPEFQDKARMILVYCKTGGRSALAAQTLQQLGYSNVVSLAGGFDAWSAGEIVPEGIKV